MFVFSKENWDFVVPKNSLDTVYYATDDDTGDVNSISTCMASIEDETYLIVADSPEEFESYMQTNTAVIFKQTSWLSIGSMFRFIFYKGEPRCLSGGADFRATSLTTHPGGPLVPKLHTFCHVAQLDDGTFCKKDGAVVAETNPNDLLAVIDFYKLNDDIDNIIAMPFMQVAPMFENIWHDDRVITMGNRLIHDPQCIAMVFGTDDDDMEEKLLKRINKNEY